MEKEFSPLGLAKIGTIDYIENNVIIKNSPVHLFLVRKDHQEEDLAVFKAEYGPGSFAVLEGVTHLWQLTTDGELETVL